MFEILPLLLLSGGTIIGSLVSDYKENITIKRVNIIDSEIERLEQENLKGEEIIKRIVYFFKRTKKCNVNLQNFTDVLTLISITPELMQNELLKQQILLLNKNIKRREELKKEKNYLLSHFN